MKNILSTVEIEKYSDITDFVMTYTRENIAYAKFKIRLSSLYKSSDELSNSEKEKLSKLR